MDKKIAEAYKRIEKLVTKTPLVECLGINEKVYLKLENLQKTGSFKIRGALNKVMNLTEKEKKRGIIASSAGNHAQGVALGAKLQGIKATIVMPEKAPKIKVNATQNYGAKVVLYGRVYDEAYNKACELQEKDGSVFVHPFDDDDVIAGQGTIGIEILEEMPDIDIVIVPVGGGGILAGIAAAIKSKNSKIKVIGVESENAASMREALKQGRNSEIDIKPSIADGIAVKKVGEKTFELVKKYVDEIVTVTEEEIKEAIIFLLEKNKVLAEGAGAASFAAILFKKIKIENKRSCVVISGGNIDLEMIKKIMN